LTNNATAGEADIENASANRTASGWSFNVTVRHGDEGWDHYADKWDVLAPDGTVLGTRILAHPHETEQPFTRSLSGVIIPENISTVTIRAHDSVHGYGGREFVLDLPK
jgi:hypothetical protein